MTHLLVDFKTVAIYVFNHCIITLCHLFGGHLMLFIKTITQIGCFKNFDFRISSAFSFVSLPLLPNWTFFTVMNHLKGFIESALIKLLDK